MEKAVFLVYLLDVISLVGVVVAVFVFAEIFEQVFLASDPRDFDQHLPVGGTAIVHITLIGIERGGLLTVLVLDQFERRDVALALGDVDIQTVGREPEQQFSTLGHKLPIQLKGV